MAVDVASPQMKALPDAIPRCQHLRTRDLGDHIAPPRQHDAAFDGDADLATVPGRESQRFVQVVVGGDARAARAEFLADTLVDETSEPTLRGTAPRTDCRLIPR